MMTRQMTNANYKEDNTMKNECKHKRPTYCCKRLRMLQYLLELGYEPIETIVDCDNWRYKNWIFENTPSLEKDIEQYFENLKAKN